MDLACAGRLFVLKLLGQSHNTVLSAHNRPWRWGWGVENEVWRDGRTRPGEKVVLEGKTEEVFGWLPSPTRAVSVIVAYVCGLAAVLRLGIHR